MTPSRFVKAFLLLLVLLGGAFFFLRPRLPEGPALPPAPAATTVLTGTAVATSFGTARPLERVVKLYEIESARIGRNDPDPELTQARLEKAARELSGEELAWLGLQALDEKNEMDARFFATYLAALAPGAAAVGTLKAIALQPLPKTRNEMRFAEERALRMQAVEGLSRNCEHAKDALLEVVAVYDEGIRDRAHRALYACQTGRKIEDGDKEALEKLRRKGGSGK